jgi:putative aldouronate transport system permease protein
MMVTSIGHSRQDAIFSAITYSVLGLALVAVLYPLYFVVIASFSSPEMVNAGRVWLYPREITVDGYRRIVADERIWIGYRNTILYTIAGTAVNLVMTLPAAYALSRRDLLGRVLITSIFAVTMFFSGGLIPRYLLVRDLGMLNSVWAMVLPNAVIFWNLIVSRSFFQTTIPMELYEAAVMDGSTNTRFFVSVVLPLSQAIIAVMALFYGVGHWNGFFDALIFLRSRELVPLQIVLRDILITVQLQSSMMDDAETASLMQRISEQIKYGVIIVATVPILMAYPFLQRYFVKGVMIGAIKG